MSRYLEIIIIIIIIDEKKQGLKAREYCGFVSAIASTNLSMLCPGQLQVLLISKLISVNVIQKQMRQ